MSEKNIPQYIPLYRKYRPKNLQEVVGQEHVKKALTNAITLNKISHAYLFTGPRGTGKTSIARILAKSLNCKEGPTLTPCEVCPSCNDIKNSNPMDVIEIDAASNRSVEDARNILEKIQYVPVNGKYKIYIIDEVHMLTTPAFNALLKTLEEPPENVIFILATTEPQKVLETITSRCQRFDFRRITTDDIIGHLKNIAKLEKIKIEDEALFTIAKNAAGGMRDSLALLDQVSVLDGSSTITSEDINKLLGRLSFDMLNKMAENIIESQPQAAIELLDIIYNSGNEPSQILTNLLGYFKNMLIVKNCKGDELLLDLTQLNSSQIKTLKTQCENIETHQIIFLIEKIVYYIKEIKTTTNQHLWLEIATIDLANLTQNTSLLELQERVSRLEGGGVNIASFPKTQPSNPITKPAPLEQAAEKLSSPATKETDAKMHRCIEAKLEETNKKEIKEVITDKLEDEVVELESPTSENNFSHVSPLTSHLEDLPTMPVSKHSVKENGGILNLWKELLLNISSPPTVSLLADHAKPIQLSAEKVVIVCEKEFSLKALGSEMKRKMISEACEKLFGKKDTSLVIRLANADDTFPEVEKKNDVDAKMPRGLEAKTNTKQYQENVIASDNESIQKNSIESANSNYDSESEELSEEEDFIEHELSKKKEAVFMPSDQVSMVVKLFDGKYID